MLTFTHTGKSCAQAVAKDHDSVQVVLPHSGRPGQSFALKRMNCGRRIPVHCCCCPIEGVPVHSKAPLYHKSKYSSKNLATKAAPIALGSASFEMSGRRPDKSFSFLLG